MTDRATSRPSTLILAIIMVLGGVISLGASIILLALPPVALSSGVPSWAIYLNIVLGILQFVAAVLVIMYKRVGLLLGLLVYIVSIVSAIISVVLGQSIQGVIAGIVVGIIALILLAQFLTKEPQKSAFA